MTLSESMDEDRKEHAATREAYRSLGYTGERCNNPTCGRARVENLVNGKRICDKCHWDQDAHAYDSKHTELHQ